MKKVIVFLSILIADQALKIFVSKNLLFATGGFLTYVCNSYISWGIPILGSVFWVVWLISNGLLVHFILRYNKNIFLFAVLAGSVSNAIDRLLYGCVVDYFRLPVGNFPIFNLADVFIVVGIIAFLFSFFGKGENTNQ